MPPRSVTISLRAGITRATLPDGRTMVQGKNTVVNWLDFEKLPASVKKNVVQVVTINATGPATEKNIDLTLNAATLPVGMKLGKVINGVQELTALKLVQVTGGAVLGAGEVLVWANKTATQVTRVHTAGAEFAGVSLGAIGNNNFAWIQTDGEAQAAFTGTAGDPLAQNPGTAAVARTATGTDVAFGTALATSAANAVGPVAIRTGVSKRKYWRQGPA